MPQLLRKLARDRLVWFIALGVLLFAIDEAARQRDATRILIDLPLVEKLVAQWEGQTKRRPNAQELDALIEGYIREEILVREAQAMGLDDDDVIIRRRLAQKVEFFLSENDPPELPDEAGLRAWFDENRALYDTPVRVSWQHVYVANAEAASKALEKLRRDDADWRQMGQPFMLNRTYARQSQIELARLMGADFAAALFAEQNEGWIGPFRSAYGWHAVKLTKRHAAQQAEFDPLAERVAADWQATQARVAEQAAWQELRGNYQIELVPVE